MASDDEDKIGIAISLYDKFEDLQILIDIIRNDWEDEYYISVCSNHKESKEILSEEDIDHFVQGDKIAYSPDMEGLRAKINLHSRILDTIKKSCIGAIDANCDYVMHLHADSWLCDESKFKNLIYELNNQNAKVALRGFGETYRRPSFWSGHVMDHFFLFDSDYFDRIEFFNFEPFDLLPHASIHTALHIRLLGQVGRGSMYYYSDLSDDKYWDGKSTFNPYTTVRPAIHNSKWGLVHVATDEFPRELGKQVQALYLEQFDIEGGKKIQDFKRVYGRPRGEILKELDHIESHQDGKLKWLGFRPEILGRDFQTKQDILQQSRREKIKYLFRNISEELYFGLMSVIFKHSPMHTFRSLPRDYAPFKGDIRTRMLYKDAKWPDESLIDMYRDRIHKDDFPQEGTFWFENRD